VSRGVDQREQAWREWIAEHARGDVLPSAYEHQCGSLGDLASRLFTLGSVTCPGCSYEIAYPEDECLPLYRVPEACGDCGRPLTEDGTTGICAAAHAPSEAGPLPSEVPSVLHEAHDLVHGARQDAYDTPTANFRRCGVLWGVVLEAWKADPAAASVPPNLVALCLAELKVSREIARPMRDNRVDLAGYTECLDLVTREQEG